MELPKGVSMSVPDLSKLAKPKALANPPVAAVVHPGDQVVVLLNPHASEAEVSGISEYLKSWAPTVNWLVIAGPQSITVIPAPSTDKEPQGHDDSECPGPPECM